MATWSTGLFDVAGEPGGIVLFLKSWLVPCLVIGDINERVGGPSGWMGGALGTCLGFGPILMFLDAPKVAEKAGFKEDGIKAFFCSACLPCYLGQVWKETEIKQMKPGQIEMN
eukprot:TRINITY_DN641_c0_g1_i6.p1 TRINITY_DN641_c0_g1~~TRINITY_DN641_c0_g1_i6.p1  ORF type:complete len:113 (-),score=38.64 TRINITY_DN641_c0_g1_i6:449-787(-)